MVCQCQQRHLRTRQQRNHLRATMALRRETRSWHPPEVVCGICSRTDLYYSPCCRAPSEILLKFWGNSENPVFSSKVVLDFLSLFLHRDILFYFTEGSTGVSKDHLMFYLFRGGLPWATRKLLCRVKYSTR